MTGVAARVAGKPISVKEIDDREAKLRAGNLASALPRPGTGESRQLRRWLTQLAVAESVVVDEAAARGLTEQHAPTEVAVLPDMAARLEIGSVAAATLALPLARAVFADIGADVDVTAADIAAYHTRNPLRFAGKTVGQQGWNAKPEVPQLCQVQHRIAAHLRAAARRRTFRLWLDAQLAQTVELAHGYEHPGDPRQPDNTHKH